ncbi:MAG: RagB/SusD family nutrient uptake outer membrane protein [Phocaeicola sp.]|nr:RagB/SusD family nutrient uptake outer membrane protein [Phocaeicola sp.]
MKNIYILLMAASLTCTSCSEDWLDLNPSTSVPTDQAFNTLEDAQSALNGIYRLASAHSYYGDNYFYYGDCRAADVQARESKGDGRRVSPYYEYNVKASDSFNSTLPWNQVYKVIRQCNNLITHVEAGDVQTTDETSLKRIKAEALAMRGLALYDLTRVFAMPYSSGNGSAPGVPIVTTALDETAQPARSTVAQCYEQVLKDLNASLEGLSREKTDGYLNYWAVQGILSRVYLNMLDYQHAYEAAAEVIENSKSLYHIYTRDEYPTVWGTEYSSESLFEFYFSLTEPSGGSGGEGAPMVYANEAKVDWNNLILSEDYLNLLDEDPDDIRHSVTQASAIANNEGLPQAARSRNVYLTKFPGKTGDPRDNNLCIVRLSEIYLNAAEAGLQLGGNYRSKALEYLNAVVTNRTDPSKAVTDADFTLNRVLKERRKELVGEGLVFYDYTRNRLPIERKGSWHLNTLDPSNARIIHPDDSRLAVPIPQSEIDANPNLGE